MVKQAPAIYADVAKLQTRRTSTSVVISDHTGANLVVRTSLLYNKKLTMIQRANTDRLERYLISFEGVPENQLESRGRILFEKVFLSNEFKGHFYTHEDTSVVIYANHFDHAFFTSPDKTTVDLARLERMRGIKLFVSGQVPTAECWEQKEKDLVKRIYMAFHEPYIVWLDKKGSGWKFRSAYPASVEYVRSKIRGGVLIERF